MNGHAKEPEIVTAAENGDYDRLVTLINQGADVHARGKGGYTALHCAAAKGDERIVDYLLGRGVDIDLRTDNNSGHDGGQTALFLAVAYGHKTVAILLLGAGARPDLRTVDGMRALERASGRGDMELVSALIDHGACVNPRGGTPPLAEALFSRQLDVAKYLLTKGARVDATIPGFDSPLLPAIASGKWLPAVDLLLSNGAHINQTDSQGRSALHNAVIAFASSKTQYEKGPSGRTTALVEKGEATLPIVARLLEAGVDPNMKDKEGLTALDWAKKTGSVVLVQLLEAHPSR